MAYDGPLDMNRPLMYCTHKASGARVFMYLDDPGLYLDQHGRPFPEEAAKEAGFQVERYRKQRIMQKERAKFEEAMKAELKISDDVETYLEKGSLRIQHYPETGMAFLERDGERLYATPIPLSTAVTLFNQFVTAEEKERAEGVKQEPGIANSTEVASSPPPTSPEAPEATPKVQNAKKGAAAMLK